MEKMRFARKTKIFLLLVTSLCGLSLWSSLGEQKEQNQLLSIETFNINRKSLAYQDSLAIDKNKKGGDNSQTNDNNNNINIKNNNNKSSSSSSNNNNNNNNNNNTIASIREIHRITPEILKVNNTTEKSVVANETAKQSRTILMSYMRSGSTFTGDLFQASPDVMYMYEPLLYTNDVDELSQNTPIRSRVISKFFKDRNLPETLDYILNTMKCNLTDSNLRYMIGYTYSRSFDDYAICMKGLKPYGTRDCGQITLKRCHQSSNVISKILRLKMWEVDKLLARDPELQIIHLVRDPRGIAMSRTMARYYLNTRTLCVRMNTDASLSMELEKKYPGRILTVRYEDLALSPLNVTRKLFHHAKVKWTPQIADKVQDLTSPRNDSFDEKIFGTKRKNSSSTAFNWRRKLPFSTALEIQKFCQKMMDLYGYNIFQSYTEMMNLGFSSIRGNYSDKYYKGDSTVL